MNLLRTTACHRASGIEVPTVGIEVPTVFVVDGNADMSQTLQSLSSSGRWHIEHVESAEAFLSFPRALLPGCVLTELRLPGLSGLEMQRQILDRPEMPVIFVCSDPDVYSTVQAMKYGAFDFFTKPCSAEVLMQTVLDALERSRHALRQLAHEQALRQRYESLSRRERDVMRLVVAGRLNKQVGAALGISEITVKAHRGQVMRKMRAASFADLVNMASSLQA